MGRKGLGIEAGRRRRGFVIGWRDLNDRREERNKMDEDICRLILSKTFSKVQR